MSQPVGRIVTSIVLVGAGVAAGVISAVYWSGWPYSSRWNATMPDGERSIILTCPSPDRQHVAYFFVESGGGAAGWQYEYVSVERTHGDKTMVLQLSHGYDAIVTWLSPTALEIGYPDSARVDHTQSWFDIQLRDSKTVLKPLPSKDGSLTGDKSHCAASAESAQPSKRIEPEDK